MNENNMQGGAAFPQAGGNRPQDQQPIPAANLHGGSNVRMDGSTTPVAGGNQPMMSSSTPMMAPVGGQTRNKKNIIDIVILVVVSLIAVAGVVCSLWLYMEWNESKTDVNGKVSAAEAAARTEQQEIDETNFAEREKQPNLQFTGPSDYGSLSFMYPRTWSVHIAKDASNGGDFEAYLHPIQVNPVGISTVNALRVTIYDRPIEQVRKTYDSLLKNGKLTMSVFQVGDITGDRYDGEFSKDIVGSMVMIKINDKTAILRTDADQFRTDFEALIATVRLN